MIQGLHLGVMGSGLHLRKIKQQRRCALVCTEANLVKRLHLNQKSFSDDEFGFELFVEFLFVYVGYVKPTAQLVNYKCSSSI